MLPVREAGQSGGDPIPNHGKYHKTLCVTVSWLYDLNHYFTEQSNGLGELHLAVGIDVSDYICLDLVTSSGSGFGGKCRKIFTERKFCDFEIVSKDGTVVPCHKVFLAFGKQSNSVFI